MADQKTLKHYLAAFVFMITWMGGPFIKTPSFPRANVMEISSTDHLLLPYPSKNDSWHPPKKLKEIFRRKILSGEEGKAANFTPPQSQVIAHERIVENGS